MEENLRGTKSRKTQRWPASGADFIRFLGSASSNQNVDASAGVPFMIFFQFFIVAFLGKLKTLKEAGDGVYLTFKVIELYKISALKSDSKFITLFKKKQENDCNCLPFLPHGKAFVMGQASLDANGLAVNLFDEHTFVEKFYGHKQMSLCWLV